MPSDSSTLKDSDDIDLGWDDEPSAPSATVQTSSSRGAERASSSARSSRLASALRDAAKVQHSTRLSPPPKPAVRSRYSLRPVSVPPRPGSSSPSSELPSDLHVEIEVAEPATPEPPQPRREFLAAPPAATFDDDVPLVTNDPVASDVPFSTRPLSTSPPTATRADDALEVASTAPAPCEWPDADVDSLGPSQLDALPDLSTVTFREQGPRRALLAMGTAAIAGLIWLVTSSTLSAEGSTAELPRAARAAAASPALASPAPAALPVAAAPSVPAALAPAAAPSTPSGEPAGTSAMNDTPDTIPVAVHLSPPDAFVFKSGRRLGRGDVTVHVTPGTKTTLVARLKGYKARIVVLDGSYTSVNIALSRAPTNHGATSSSPRENPDSSADTLAVDPSRSAPKNEVAATSDAPSQPSGASDSSPSAAPTSITGGSDTR